jgi:hypothetical protein
MLHIIGHGVVNPKDPGGDKVGDGGVVRLGDERMNTMLDTTAIQWNKKMAPARTL